MPKPSILIVEDDLHMLELLSVHIEAAGYNVIKAENGLDALTVLEKKAKQLDAIVSDVEMPHLNGYELCQQVREIKAIKGMPFIFVSARTSLEEKIKGFEVGGDDYIAKPVEGEEVVVKVKHIIENKIRHHDLEKQLEEARNAAVQAMSYSSNLGQVLQFIKSTLDIDSFDMLSRKLFEVGTGLGLVFIIQFRTPDGLVNYRRDGEVTPLEANVIELSRPKGRIFDFQSRTIFNYDDFSLLVLNMPLEDEERYGLIKDVLGSLCDALESRVRLLSSDAVLRQKEGVINSVTASLKSVEQAYRDIHQANLSAIDDMIHNMEEAMYGFGLSEGQEDSVRSIVMQARTRANDIFGDGRELFKEFEKIQQVLAHGLK